MRTASASSLAGDGLAARHTELLSEVAQTRSLLVRFLNKQIHKQMTDTPFYTAEGVAQSDVATKQRRGGAAGTSIASCGCCTGIGRKQPCGWALSPCECRHQYKSGNDGSTTSEGLPSRSKACVKVCPFLHYGVARIALSIPLSEHNGRALVVQSSLSCSMTHSLCSDHIPARFWLQVDPRPIVPALTDS